MMTLLQYKIRSLLHACRKWGHSRGEAEDLIQDALLAVEAYSHDHEVHCPESFAAETPKHHSINASGPEAACMTQQRLEKIESVVVQLWGRMTYDVFMYQRSGYTYQQTARKFGLTERAVQIHIVRAMFVLINQKAGEQQ